MTREMLTPQLNDHGIGPGTGGTGDSITFGHGGANEGFRCNLYAFTNLGQGLVIMTNGDRGGELMTEILRSFSAVYNWDSYKPAFKTIVSLDDEEMNRFSGQYQLTIQGNELILEISVLEKHLKGMQ